MGSTEEVFHLVVQRKRIEDESQADPQQGLFPEMLGLVDDQSVHYRGYVYRAIATNLDAHGPNDHEVVQFYKQRGDSCENRMKEYCSEFSAARLPCSNFDTNAAFFKLWVLAYKVLAPLRMMLLASWESFRATTIRYRLYAMAAQVVGHAHQWMLKPDASRTAVFDHAAWSIRNCVLKLPRHPSAAIHSFILSIDSQFSGLGKESVCLN